MGACPPISPPVAGARIITGGWIVDRLNGKVAVVTGGNSGMGLATAKLFVREGAKVVITGRDQAALDAAVKEIGEGAEAFRGDISTLADLDALASHVEQKYGRVDAVFANAGGGRPGLFEQVSEDDFDFTVDTNLKGTYFTVQKLLPLMTSGGSVILNTAILGSQGRPGFSVYSATKAAIRSLARSLTAELSAKGYPGECARARTDRHRHHAQGGHERRDDPTGQ